MLGKMMLGGCKLHVAGFYSYLRRRCAIEISDTSRNADTSRNGFVYIQIPHNTDQSQIIYFPNLQISFIRLIYI